MAAMEELDPSEMSGMEEDELLPLSARDRQVRLAKTSRQNLAMSYALGAAALFGCLAFLVVWVAGPVRGVARRPAGPVPLRRVLEGQEMAHITAKNIVAMGGPGVSGARHELVHAQVEQGQQKFWAKVHEQHPELHEELGAVQLNAAQQESVFKALNRYGDPRLIGLSHDVAAAVADNTKEGGNEDALQRRLSDKLGPKVALMRKLGDEMFPDKDVTFDMRGELPTLDKWHPELEVDWSGSSPSAARRLEAAAASAAVDEGVRLHARTALKSVQRELDGQLSQAHARKLLSLFDDDTTTSRSSTSKGTESFMTCVQKAVPNPMKCASCIQDHLSSVIGMLTKYLHP